MAAVLLAAAWATGCGQANLYTSPQRYEQGLVICLSGAGGMMGECERIREGLAAGGVDRAIEIFDWSRGDVLSDQASVEGNRRIAADLARHVECYLANHPGKPVHLVGISAGTGIVVWALEELQEGMQVEGAVILASSLDTKYDLAKALARVRDHLWSFNSLADTVLSLGVTWAGTVDRKGGIAGGLVGFSPPDGAPDDAKALYHDRLVQTTWWPGDMVLGHMGDHLGATNPTFVRVRIAPLVLGKEPPKIETPPDVRTAKAPPPKAAEKWAAADGLKAGAARTGKPASAKAQPAKPEKQRFFGWMVRRSAAAGSAASPAQPGQAVANQSGDPAAPAPGARSAAGQSSGKGPAGEAAPEEIDESLFFSETGRLP
ncbi:MAG: alpha/beta hydrolase [Planctomycetes bacterium]|nr:alpha/beta hydrolase [Planctomycetota bacterium]